MIMLRFFFAAGLLLLAVSGCKNSSARREKDKIGITVSILPLKYIIEQITGDDFAVEILVPKGASPETYEPQPNQLKAALQSKLYINIGLLDSEITLSNALRESGVTVIDLYKNVDLLTFGEENGDSHGQHHGHIHQGIDPHVWTSPKEVKKMTEAICDRIVSLVPDSADKYRTNLAAFEARIDSLDHYIKQTLAGLDSPYFIIYHPAMGYYARDYGLVQLSIEEDGKETSAAVLKTILNTVREQKINVIFYQSQFSSSSVASLARETGARAIEIDPLSYEWMENLFNITNALKLASNPSY